jgi:uncharacterized protein (TIGR03118 family)
MKNQFLLACVLVSAIFAGETGTAAGQAYQVTNLVSDGSVPALTMDANFINPWAMSTSGTWWVSAQGTGYNYAIANTGTISFKVIVPAASGLTTATGLPAGSVTTGGAVGMLLSNGTKASFLFSTLDGTISGWNSKLGTANAVSLVAINNSTAGASYPGLAVLNIQTAGVTSASYLLAANFGAANAIEVYDSTFAPATLAGGTFTDPTLPAGYAPFSVHILGSQIFVAYALKTSTGRATFGLGNGIVSIFDQTGKFVSRAVTGGNLNAPWGVAIAPANFGVFSGDLLIGNQGDGLINVYNPTTFEFLGQLMDGTGKSLSYANLWELLTGGTAVAGTTAVSGGNTSTVYFTAGLAGETHGLLGAIANATTAGSLPTFGFSSSATSSSVTAGGSAQALLSVAPVNGFSGTVALSCSGLPAGASCVFGQQMLPVSANAASQTIVGIQTTQASGGLLPMHLRANGGSGVAAALVLPGLLLFRRRKSLGALTRLTVLTLLLVGSIGAGSLLSGCSSSSMAATATPTGMSNVVITATSGSISQTTTVAITVM